MPWLACYASLCSTPSSFSLDGCTDGEIRFAAAPGGAYLDANDSEANRVAPADVFWGADGAYKLFARRHEDTWCTACLTASVEGGLALMMAGPEGAAIKVAEYGTINSPGPAPGRARVVVDAKGRVHALWMEQYGGVYYATAPSAAGPFGVPTSLVVLPEMIV